MFFVCLLVCLFVICFLWGQRHRLPSLCVLLSLVCKFNCLLVSLNLYLVCFCSWETSQRHWLPSLLSWMYVCISSSLYVFVFSINQRHRSPSLLSSWRSHCLPRPRSHCSTTSQKNIKKIHVPPKKRKYNKTLNLFFLLLLHCCFNLIVDQRFKRAIGKKTTPGFGQEHHI